MEPKEAPAEYVCSISLELMGNPVRLKQTGMTYDHASFHDWLTCGGTTCPLTGIRLRNPIVLEPQRALRRKIWSYISSQQSVKDSCVGSIEVSGSKKEAAAARPLLPHAQVLRQSLAQRQRSRRALEEELQQTLAADRLPHRPYTGSPNQLSLWRQLQTTFARWRRSSEESLESKGKKPSTYCVTTGGRHVYCRGDL